MRNVPFPPPLTFPVEVYEADPWSPRPPGAKIPTTLLTTIQVKFERSVDERRRSAKAAAEKFFNNKRSVSVNVADDKIIATVTKPRPEHRVTRP